MYRILDHLPTSSPEIFDLESSSLSKSAQWKSVGEKKCQFGICLEPDFLRKSLFDKGSWVKTLALLVYESYGITTETPKKWQWKKDDTWQSIRLCIQIIKYQNKSLFFMFSNFLTKKLYNEFVSKSSSNRVTKFVQKWIAFYNAIYFMTKTIVKIRKLLCIG